MLKPVNIKLLIHSPKLCFKTYMPYTPTRVYNQSATLLDNIFVNKIENPILSRNIVSDISDSFSQFCIMQSDKYINYQYQTNAKIREYYKFSQSKLNDDIYSTNYLLVCYHRKQKRQY